jgi:zinc transport system substrate-binding protein
VTSFYPLQFVTERIAGDAVTIHNLTKPGAEPHDLELSAKAVGNVARADAVVYLRGFQSAVDDAVDSQADDRSLDVSHPARLDLQADEHDEESPSGPHAHGGRAPDPHFWLDPERYADVADAIAVRLTQVDPQHAQDYRARVKVFTDRLAALDDEFAAGLRSCRSRELVTSHAAFGYLAEAYDLHQEGITGIDPEAEPSPTALARIAAFVNDEGVRTIFAETLASREVAETLARETGAQLAVLDPIEGITDESAGPDYFAVMRADLAALRRALVCA